MEDLTTLFCSSKFPWAREKISLKFTDNLGTRPQKVCQPCSRWAEKKHEFSFSVRSILFGIRFAFGAKILVFNI